ncbi:hypothetical protein CVT26_006353 [Gymnopilus dilepis]|uniref:Uncharacterized protein n=1 Tax=Gymnopilus dilepis TaxID=231916 RepID=A0A409W645_9AGAR|nr:hypothetical protein CVT26_006353 [Gymnopilus dilepis]
MQLQQASCTTNSTYLNDANTNAMGPATSYANPSPPSNNHSDNDASDSDVIDQLIQAADAVHDSPITDFIVDLVPCFIDAFKEVRENRHLLRSLALSCNSTVRALHDSYKITDDKEQWLVNNAPLVGPLQSELLDIKNFLTEMKDKKLFARLLATRRDKKKILDYTENLKMALDRFKVVAQIELSENLDQCRRGQQQMKESLMIASNTSAITSSLSSLTLNSNEHFAPDRPEPGLHSGHATPSQAARPSSGLPSVSNSAKPQGGRTDLRAEISRLEEMLEELRTPHNTEKPTKPKLNAGSSDDEGEESDSTESDHSFEVEVQRVQRIRTKKTNHGKSTKKKPHSKNDATPVSQQSSTANLENFTYNAGWSNNPAAYAPHPHMHAPPFPVNPFGAYTGVSSPGFSFAHGISTGPHLFNSPNYPYTYSSSNSGTVTNNVGSGNYSYSSVSNVGNDYSVNHDVPRRRKRDFGT